MKPLIILITVFLITLIVIKISKKDYRFALSGRIALSVMLIFTATGHFAFTKGMIMMVPSFIPFKTEIVYGTGVIEILFAIGLLLPKYRILTAWLLIIFMVLVLPANIYASVNHVDYQNATFHGNGLEYLWFRIPLQLLFIVWTYLFAVRN